MVIQDLIERSSFMIFEVFFLMIFLRFIILPLVEVFVKSEGGVGTILLVKWAVSKLDFVLNEDRRDYEVFGIKDVRCGGSEELCSLFWTRQADEGIKGVM